MTVMNMLPLKPSLLFRPRRLWSFAFRAASRGSLSYRQPAAAFSTAAAVKAEPRRGGIWRADDTWPGLAAWRAAAVDERVIWGDKGAREPPEAESQTGPLGESLAQCARQVLMTADPSEKARLTHQAWRAYKSGTLPIGTAEARGAPARPSKPALVPPKRIPPMKHSPLPANVYMLHNLAHIELNAIDLAWDTVARFSGLGLPEDFYADFARVADDEARHLGWCLQRMGELGYEYGCMPAHNLLWEGAEMSSGDLLARLAVVPMSQEARGLDAGKRLAEKLVGWGDNRSAAVVHRIALEERNHVAVGVTWFQAICEALGVDPGPAFRSLLLELCPDLLKGPFNYEERALAGLPQGWYDTSLWPPEQRAAVEALKNPAGKARGAAAEGAAGGAAAAAAALPGEAGEADGSLSRAQGTSTASSSSGGGGSGGSQGGRLQQASRDVAIPPQLQQDDEQLQRLRQRLAAMLEIELRMS